MYCISADIKCMSSRADTLSIEMNEAILEDNYIYESLRVYSLR